VIHKARDLLRIIENKRESWIEFNLKQRKRERERERERERQTNTQTEIERKRKRDKEREKKLRPGQNHRQRNRHGRLPIHQEKTGSLRKFFFFFDE